MLKYSLLPMERAFAFQITEQSSEIKKAINYVGGSFFASNGWTIKMDVYPEIRVASRTIYLRGNTSASDLRVDRTWNLKSNRERDEIISQVNAALAEIISLASSYSYRYQVGPSAWLGVHQNYYQPITWSAPEADVVLGDSPESGWGANRLSHPQPIFQC